MKTQAAALAAILTWTTTAPASAYHRRQAAQHCAGPCGHGHSAPMVTAYDRLRARLSEEERRRLDASAIEGNMGFDLDLLLEDVTGRIEKEGQIPSLLVSKDGRPGFRFENRFGNRNVSMVFYPAVSRMVFDPTVNAWHRESNPAHFQVLVPRGAGASLGNDIGRWSEAPSAKGAPAQEVFCLLEYRNGEWRPSPVNDRFVTKLPPMPASEPRMKSSKEDDAPAVALPAPQSSVAPNQNAPQINPKNPGLVVKDIPKPTNASATAAQPGAKAFEESLKSALAPISALLQETKKKVDGLAESQLAAEKRIEKAVSDKIAALALDFDTKLAKQKEEIKIQVAMRRTTEFLEAHAANPADAMKKRDELGADKLLHAASLYAGSFLAGKKEGIRRKQDAGEDATAEIAQLLANAKAVQALLPNPSDLTLEEKWRVVEELSGALLLGRNCDLAVNAEIMKSIFTVAPSFKGFPPKAIKGGLTPAEADAYVRLVAARASGSDEGDRLAAFAELEKITGYEEPLINPKLFSDLAVVLDNPIWAAVPQNRSRAPWVNDPKASEEMAHLAISAMGNLLSVVDDNAKTKNSNGEEVLLLEYRAGWLGNYYQYYSGTEASQGALVQGDTISPKLAETTFQALKKVVEKRAEKNPSLKENATKKTGKNFSTPAQQQGAATSAGK